MFTDKAASLGLKINTAKTKAMAIKCKQPAHPLQVQGTDISWVRSHLYLGIWIDYHLSQQKEVTYLRERAAPRWAVMKKISSLDGGASYQVLRLFYIQAIRSLIDFSAPALVGLTPLLTQKLEVIQNNAMRTILGAPMWTRICNLQVESHLPPLSA